jgi:hypothetical protein
MTIFITLGTPRVLFGPSGVRPKDQCMQLVYEVAKYVVGRKM